MLEEFNLFLKSCFEKSCVTWGPTKMHSFTGPSLWVEIIALNSRILRLVYSWPSRTFQLIQCLCDMEVNIFSSCWLKFYVSHYTNIEALLYMVTPALRLAAPFTQEATQVRITSLQPSQHCHNLQVTTLVPLVVFVLFFFQHTMKVGTSFFHVRCRNKRYFKVFVSIT